MAKDMMSLLLHLFGVFSFGGDLEVFQFMRKCFVGLKADFVPVIIAVVLASFLFALGAPKVV